MFRHATDQYVNIEMLTDLNALKLENSHLKKEMDQAQGKVVLLASVLHTTWHLISRYSERVRKWTSIHSKWSKEAERGSKEFTDLMEEMGDNKELNKEVLGQANSAVNELANAFETALSPDNTFLLNRPKPTWITSPCCLQRT